MAFRRAGAPGAAVASAVAALLVLSGCGGGAPDPGPAPTGPPPSPATAAASPSPARPVAAGPYVALGDSYTSGLQVPPQQGTPKGCGRSGVNYPSLVAAGLGLAAADFQDVSCSGARTADLTRAQQTSGGANPPQLGAVTAATRLVTLGIGGNDVGFMDVLGRCAMESIKYSVSAALTAGPAADASAAPCKDHYTAADGGDEVGRTIDATGPRLAEALREIRRRAPQAQVLVVGYPALLPADPAACTAALGQGVAAGDLRYLEQKQEQLNSVLERAAEAGGARFVDTAAPSAAHHMCAGDADRWVEPPVPAAGLAPMHPNAAGERAMAAAVLAVLAAR
ncbi:SGNH/GDSL hydrolase family protein [Kitasatospora sp. MBT63]|uniref:SGNH/GDSL hydrolase family protein n=1 Tax=Kitasatospora sp. MBT63 TaxID=1444768 RepID=UPI00068A7301|nr:SGNH/GDSL hydrolase family protein [Kitasatospora sp. MBT63]